MDIKLNGNHGRGKLRINTFGSLLIGHSREENNNYLCNGNLFI
jgi:hypothetical protein